MFALVFWPHVTIFWKFWLHECPNWRLKFNSKLFFWRKSRQIFEVRAIEQRRYEFQPTHVPPHQFWPRYYSAGLSPVHIRFEIFSKEIYFVQALFFTDSLRATATSGNCEITNNIQTATVFGSGGKSQPRDLKAEGLRMCISQKENVWHTQYPGTKYPIIQT